MHAFGKHLHQFQSLYTNTNYFNQEGHDKFNDIETINYFRATNRKGNYMNQLINKFNRAELTQLEFKF